VSGTVGHLGQRLADCAAGAGCPGVGSTLICQSDHALHSVRYDTRAMTSIPRPNPCFLDTQIKLRRSGGARWSSPDGSRLWEWDSLHGHIEGYNKRGRHVGVFDAVTGQRVGLPVPGRRIDV
jgi:hypothetical protein